MNKNKKKIEEILEETRFAELGLDERERVWQNIARSIDKEPVLSPFPWFLPVNSKSNKFMIPLMIGAMMFLGVGGTVALADNSLPGDALYGVNRATERVRIVFANGENKDELRARFAEKRLVEVDSLIAHARMRGEAGGFATTTADGKVLFRVGHGIENAVSYLNEVAAKLEASGNVEAKARIEAVIEKLEAKINDPDISAHMRGEGMMMFRSENPEDFADFQAHMKARVEMKDDGERIRIRLMDGSGPNANTEARMRMRVGDDDGSDDSEGRLRIRIR
jgi:hypothetical protein